ncbi:MAG: DNA-binding protein [Candidatus Brocadia sp.]|nr:DNA-binding protein [Candidatus Brocadia sp.]
MENDIRPNDLTPAYQQIAEVIGIENAVKLGKEFGGEQFYLPKLGICLSKARKRKIVEEFRGGNYGELARKYCVTSSWVREIIREHKRKKASNAG